ncbi:hypothetical protein D3C78_395180 [compost metagenome]
MGIAQQLPAGIAHFYGGAWLTLPAQRTTVCVQPQALCWLRCFEVVGSDSVGSGSVARSVRLGDGQRLTVELRWVDGYPEATVGLHHGGAQYCAASAGDAHLRAGFAATGNHGAIGGKGQAGGGVGRLVVRSRQVDRC